MPRQATKVRFNITIDADIAPRLKGLNASSICNQALRAAVESSEEGRTVTLTFRWVVPTEARLEIEERRK